MTDAPVWSMSRWVDAVDQPKIVDEALDRGDPYVGVAVLTLVLNYPDADVALPRIKRALESASAQTRANALQSLGHHARLHGVIDAESVARLRRALRDHTVLQGYEIRGYARNAADDVAMFAPRHRLPDGCAGVSPDRLDLRDVHVGADAGPTSTADSAL